MIRMLPNWCSHFERPDESFPDYVSTYDEYDLYFGYDDFDEEFRVYEDLKAMNAVDEYTGAAADEVVDEYFRMGPPDADYMNEVKRQWQR